MGKQNSTERVDKGSEKTPKEVDEGRVTWDSWLSDMSDRDQPDACTIDDKDCDSCGS